MKKGSLLAVRRGRPRNVERRRAIVQVALNLFADHGYAGTSMREIARQCGIGDTLLYRYYASKREILDAVVDHVFDAFHALEAALARIDRQVEMPREFLHAAGATYLQHLDECDASYALWFESLPLSAEQRAKLGRTQENAFCAIADGLRRRGSWRDPYVAARTFTGALLGLMLFQKRARFEVATSALRSLFLEELVALVMAGAEDSAVDEPEPLERPRV